MVTLVLALHNHQPVGNFDWVFEDSYRDAYLPLLEVLEGHPDIRFAQHYTGILLDWFERKHPEQIERVRRLVERGQVELISGGYYEPILAMLPERDRREQIERLNRRIEGMFGVKPEGMWLAERVWEPSLPSTIAPTGLRYTFLDDTHFLAAGLGQKQIRGWFLTEDQGMPLAVLPIDRRLRYTIPFEDPEATIEHLRSLEAEGEENVAVFADDGEKFGVWPDTHRSVYGERWLERFCEALERNRSWLRTVHPREVVRTIPPAGRIYLPTASYAEMGHWSLLDSEGYQSYEHFEHALKDAKLLPENERFVRGGFWRNFMVKYPEVNRLQKRMLRVSERLDRARRSGGGNDPRIERAAQGLLAAQCNCPYWHGVFGGIYLSNIRAAMYRSLIEAGRELDAIEGIAQGRIEVSDYDCEGTEETLYDNAQVAAVIRPAAGGTITEFDGKGIGHNFCDLIARRPEGYHAQLAAAAKPGKKSEEGEGAKSIHDMVRAKESGLERALHYDAIAPALLVDRFPSRRPTARALQAGTIVDRGDFAGGAYSVEHYRSAPLTIVVMRRDGRVGKRPVRVEKSVAFHDESADMIVGYAVTALDDAPLTGCFCVELAYTMSAGTEPDRYYALDGVRAEEKGGQLNGAGEGEGTRLSLVDEWLRAQIDLEFAGPTRIVRAPVETVSLSEGGFERNYQGSRVMACWTLEDVRWETRFTQRLVRLPGDS